MSFEMCSTVSLTVNSGRAAFGYQTCPICLAAMKKTAQSIAAHLFHHSRRKSPMFPAVLVPYVAALLGNRKGCNAIIARLDEDNRGIVLGFVAASRALMVPAEVPCA